MLDGNYLHQATKWCVRNGDDGIANDRTNLSRNTSRNDNDLDALEGLVQLVGGISLNLKEHLASSKSERQTISYLTRGVDVANIGSNTRRTADII